MKLRMYAVQNELKSVDCEIKFRCKTDGSLTRMLDLFKGEQRGILVFDPTGEFRDSLVPAVQITPGLNLTYEIIKGDKNDKDSFSKITIQVEPQKYDSKDQLNKRLARYKNQVLQVIKALGDLGNDGHSFEICFYPENKQAKIQEFGWDGDGSDFIFMDDLKKEFKNLES